MAGAVGLWANKARVPRASCRISAVSVCAMPGKKIHYVKTHFLHKKTKQELFKEGRENGEYCTLKIDSAPKTE